MKKMKKIIALLILSVFFTSCTDSTENKLEIETPTIEIEDNTDIQDIENIIIEEIEAVEENNINTDEEIKINTGETINEEVKIKDTNTQEIVSDEESLETEVNDLLDEFIDSLDSYDK